MSLAEFKMLVIKCEELQSNDRNGSYVEDFEALLGINIEVVRLILRSRDTENTEKIIDKLIFISGYEFCEFSNDIDELYTKLLNGEDD